MSTPILFDCDPGHDDAIALLLALASPELEVLGVTTVAGNTTLPKTTANALRVLELADRSDVPVAAGCDRPLVRDLVVAEHVHGATGLDGPMLLHGLQGVNGNALILPRKPTLRPNREFLAERFDRFRAA